MLIFPSMMSPKQCGRFFFGLVSLGLCCLALPEEVLAWGPGVHMVTGNWVLQNLTALSPAMAALLMRYPGQFLHGCLSADIFIGKGSVAREGHSHNWDSAFALLRRADRGRRKAYAYGYLAHLAADTVAHNVYVPESFARAPGSGRFAHVYLEAQADRLLAWDCRDALRVFHERESRDTAALLRSTQSQKPFLFWLKSRVFQGSIALGGSRVWRSSMALVDSLLPRQIAALPLDDMLTVATRAIISLLRNPETSPVLAFDPIGANALALAQRRGRGKSVRRIADTIRLALSAKSVAGTREPGLPLPNVVLPEAMASLPPVCTPLHLHEPLEKQ